MNRFWTDAEPVFGEGRGYLCRDKLIIHFLNFKVMGKIHPDLAGAFTRTIGGTVYYMRYGENLARRKGVQGENRQFSDAQVLQQSKFGLLNTVGCSMRDVVEVGFPQRKRTQSGVNAFVQENQRVCRELGGGDVSLNYEEMLCAKGSLHPPFVQVSRDANGIVFTNRPMAERTASMQGNDRVMVVAFDPVDGFCRSLELCKRGDEAMETVTLPDYWQQENLVFYTFAVNAGGTRASRSLYLVPEEG